MSLEQIDSSTFVDLGTLIFVRFDDLDQDSTAILKFKTGEAETLTGEAARILHKQLTRSTTEGIRAPEDTRSSSLDAEPPNEPHPPMTIRLTGIDTGILLGRNKAWFHRKNDDGRDLILAFVNAKGSCSVRTFDAEHGTNLGKHYRSGNYQEQFADLLDGATELTVNTQPNLERDCKERLPKVLLVYLRKQIS